MSCLYALVDRSIVKARRTYVAGMKGSRTIISVLCEMNWDGQSQETWDLSGSVVSLTQSDLSGFIPEEEDGSETQAIAFSWVRVVAEVTCYSNALSRSGS
jgi:hypothetical protein